MSRHSADYGSCYFLHQVTIKGQRMSQTVGGLPTDPTTQKATVGNDRSGGGKCAKWIVELYFLPSPTKLQTDWRFPPVGWYHQCSDLKGEVRTINDRNICERRSCMKNNGKSPTFKFVSGEERRPSEDQRLSWVWHLPGTTHSSADLTWIRKWLEIRAPELSELESVEPELGSCCSDLDNVSDEICRTRKGQFEIPFRL